MKVSPDQQRADQDQASYNSGQAFLARRDGKDVQLGKTVISQWKHVREVSIMGHTMEPPIP